MLNDRWACAMFTRYPIYTKWRGWDLNPHPMAYGSTGQPQRLLKDQSYCLQSGWFHFSIFSNIQITSLQAQKVGFPPGRAPTLPYLGFKLSSITPQPSQLAPHPVSWWWKPFRLLAYLLILISMSKYLEFLQKVIRTWIMVLEIV